MSRESLTAAAVEAAKPRPKPYKRFDAGGMYLLVTPSGARYWRLKYRIDGVEKLISLGVYPARSLKAARAARAKAKALLDAGVDPSAQRQSDKARRRSDRENTFEAVVREWFDKKSRPWAESHAKSVRTRIDRHLVPAFGSVPIASLTGARLLQELQKIEATGAIETAHRCRQYLQAIFRYAIQTHRIQADPTPHTGALTPVKGGKFASITDSKGIGALMRSIRGYQGALATTTALRLAPLVFVRPGEIRSAEWEHIALDAAEWAIPAERMKMRRAHIIPLSEQAVSLLREIEPLTGHGRYVFPSERSPVRPMSENTLNAALRTLGFTKQQMTAHGFRHMASTQLHESRKFRSEAIERQLAHVDQNQIRAIYNAAEYLDERREMMQWWADRLDTLSRTVNLVSLKARA